MGDHDYSGRWKPIKSRFSLRLAKMGVPLAKNPRGNTSYGKADSGNTRSAMSPTSPIISNTSTITLSNMAWRNGFGIGRIRRFIETSRRAFILPIGAAALWNEMATMGNRPANRRNLESIFSECGAFMAPIIPNSAKLHPGYAG
jgi:hypothetical protein